MMLLSTRNSLLLLFLLAAGCAPSIPDPVMIIRSEKLMGTGVSLTVVHADSALANQAVDAAFEEMARLEGLFSAYLTSSEISQLNLEGSVAASPETVAVLEKAQAYSRLTHGAFDITVQPILALYRESFQTKDAPPGPEAVAEALQQVGYEQLRIKDSRVTLPQNAGLTLGAIGKGLIIDAGADVLIKQGIESGLVNAGGDMRAIGSKAGEPWQVALQNPRNPEDYLAILPLENWAVATSGDYERYFEPTKAFHHIIDPRTGYSARSLISVTILAERALDADALATSAFVLGPEKGLELIEQLSRVEGLLITAERQLVFSSGLMDLSISKPNLGLTKGRFDE